MWEEHEQTVITLRRLWLMLSDCEGWPALLGVLTAFILLVWAANHSSTIVAVIAIAVLSICLVVLPIVTHCVYIKYDAARRGSMPPSHGR